MTIDTKYKIGEQVYLITERDQNAFHVVGYLIGRTSMLYVLESVSGGSYNAFEFQISREKNMNELLGL